jgi:hypothetical protein
MSAAEAATRLREMADELREMHRQIQHGLADTPPNTSTNLYRGRVRNTAHDLLGSAALLVKHAETLERNAPQV